MTRQSRKHCCADILHCCVRGHSALRRTQLRHVRDHGGSCSVGGGGDSGVDGTQPPHASARFAAGHRLASLRPRGSKLSREVSSDPPVHLVGRQALERGVRHVVVVCSTWKPTSFSTVANESSEWRKSQPCLSDRHQASIIEFEKSISRMPVVGAAEWTRMRGRRHDGSSRRAAGRPPCPRERRGFSPGTRRAPSHLGVRSPKPSCSQVMGLTLF
jgi:hypothetical protein